MVKNRINQKSGSHGKGWLRRLVGLVTVIVFGGLVFVVLVALWLIPGAMEQRVRQELSQWCEGPVRIRQIQTNYSGRIVLNGVRFEDKTNRPWLTIDQMTIILANWPGLDPTVDFVQIDGLDLQISNGDEKWLLPAVRWPESDEQDQGSNLQKLSINRGTVTLVAAQGEKVVYDGITLSVSRKTDQEYAFDLERTPEGDSEAFVVRGDVNVENAGLDISLDMKHQFTKPEMTLAFMALGVPRLSAEGQLVADLAITGRLDKPLTLRATGSAELSDGVLFCRDGTLANHLMSAVRLDGQRLDVNEFTATMCKGPVKGTFHAEVQDDRIVEYRGQVRAESVSYPELTSVLLTDANETSRGTLRGGYDFSGRFDDANSVHGKGAVFLDDVDVSILPVIPTVFEFLGLSQFTPLKTSDVEAKFENAGPLVTVESGHVANKFAAVEFEPGGTIDLSTKQVDGYVVAAPLRQLTGPLERLPVIDIFANLKDRLTRLRLKGKWTDPPSKLIKKEPIEDIKDSTLGFIQDVAKTGGQFGQGLINGISSLLKAPNKKNK
ncbi:MAG: hypothetical protein P8Z79_13450 [Sedimentisphaerales bacterium]